jgi:hypothetical protein
MSIRKRLIKLFNKYNLPIDLLDNYEEFGIEKGKVYYQQNGIREKYIRFNIEYGLRLHKDKNKKIGLQIVKNNIFPTKKEFLKNIVKDINSEFYNILYNNHQYGGATKSTDDDNLETKINNILINDDDDDVDVALLNNFYDISNEDFTNISKSLDPEQEKLINDAVDFLLPKVLNSLIDK